ncbi:MAG: hypothetical protein ACHQNE_04010, partial [Candidatus Kapaibacterium sp.]
NNTMFSKTLYYGIISRPCIGCESYTVITSHEICEAITDPEPINPGGGWFDSIHRQGEIADVCPGYVVVSDGRGNEYEVALIWSPTAQRCTFYPVPEYSLKEFSLNYSAIGTPALACRGNDVPLILSWTSPDAHIHIMSSDDPPVSSSTGAPLFFAPIDLGETIGAMSSHGPSATFQGLGNLWLAWTDLNHRINVMPYGGSKQILSHDSSPFGPCITYVPFQTEYPNLPSTLVNRFYIAYVATNTSTNFRGIYILSSQDGVNWDRRIGPIQQPSLNVITNTTPYLTFIKGKLYLLWQTSTENDPSPATSPFCNEGQIYMGNLWIMESTDGINFVNSVPLSTEPAGSRKFSCFAPSLIEFSGEDLMMFWSQLGVAFSALGPEYDTSTLASGYIGNEYSYYGGAGPASGIALANYHGKILGAWAGIDNTLRFTEFTSE